MSIQKVPVALFSKTAHEIVIFLCEEHGWSLVKLQRESGINRGSLSRYYHDIRGCNEDNYRKLLTVLIKHELLP